MQRDHQMAVATRAFCNEDARPYLKAKNPDEMPTSSYQHCSRFSETAPAVSKVYELTDRFR